MKIKFDTRLNPETIEQIKKQANHEKRSKCAVARNIIEEYYEKRKLQKQSI